MKKVKAFFLAILEWLDRKSALVAAMAALFTAIITYWTLKEMEYDRYIANLPDIYIKDTWFEVQMSPEPTSNFALNILSTDSSGLNRSAEHPDIDLYNFGRGLARNVRASWSYDMDSCMQFPISRYFEAHLTDKTLKINSKVNGSNVLVYPAEFMNQNVDFLRPYDQDARNTVEVPIPPAYLYLYSCFFFENLGKNDLHMLNTFPRLNLSLTYEDISQDVLTKEFTVQCQPNVGETKKDSNQVRLHRGTFQVLIREKVE